MHVTVLAAVLCSGGGGARVSSFLLQVFTPGLESQSSFLSYLGPVTTCPTGAGAFAPSVPMEAHSRPTCGRQDGC